MSLIVANKMTAECLPTDCNNLGDNKKKQNVFSASVVLQYVLAVVMFVICTDTFFPS